MKGNRGADTSLELAVRRALWAAGLRGYRKNVKGLPGKPDVVFGRARLAVFLHGCYWHQCPACARNLMPRRNGEFWRAKFDRNAERDRHALDDLEALGYQTLVVWECEAKRDLTAVVRRIGTLVDATP